MSEFQWSDDYRLGVESLDYEHRDLFMRIDELLTDLAEHRDKRRVERCLGDIHARMAAHFALEEEMMRKADYLYRERHKEEHDLLLDRLTQFAEDLLAADAVDEESRHSLESELKHWIVHHVKTSDAEMAAAIV